MTRLKRALSGTDWVAVLDDLNAGLVPAVVCTWLSVAVSAWWLW